MVLVSGSIVLAEDLRRLKSFIVADARGCKCEEDEFALEIPDGLLLAC